MTVRKLPGTPTINAEVFWTEIANHDGWRIQFNPTISMTGVLKPYRLLDPQDYLWASADGADELIESLPSLVEWVSGRQSLFTEDDVRKALRALAKVALKAAARRVV